MSDLSNFLANAKGDRSIDEISKQAYSKGHPISRSAIAKYLRGEHGPRPPESTLEGLAAGFGVDPRELRRLAGRTPGELGPYVPTDESASLTRKQRDALDQLIKTIVSDRGETNGKPAASKKSGVGPEAGDAPIDIQDIMTQSRGGFRRAAADDGELLDDREAEPDEFNQASEED